MSNLWHVEVAEYQGEGYWADYPPMPFDTEAEARAYAARVTNNLLNTKVRRVYEVTK